MRIVLEVALRETGGLTRAVSDHVIFCLRTSIYAHPRSSAAIFLSGTPVAQSVEAMSADTTGGDTANFTSSSSGPAGFVPLLLSSQLADLCDYSSEMRNLPFARWELTFQPYWLIVSMAITLTLGAYLANLLLAETSCGRRTMKWITATFYPKVPSIDRQQSESGISSPDLQRDVSMAEVDRLTLPGEKPITSADRLIIQVSEAILADPVVRWALMPPSGLLTIQLMLQGAHVIYIGCTLHADQSSWHKYEELYARVLNGGASSFLLPFLIAKLDGEAQRRHRKGWRNNASHYLLNLWSIFLLPALITHGILVYVFIPLIIAITSVLCLASNARAMLLLLTKCGKSRPGMMVVIMGLNIIVTMAIQMAFNYGVLLYGGENYFRTMSARETGLNGQCNRSLFVADIALLDWSGLFSRYLEYQMRDTSCYVHALSHQIQPMVFSFASIF